MPSYLSPLPVLCPVSQSIIGPNTLRALALMRPGTAKQLFSVEGMGAERANRYGQAIIDVRGGGGGSLSEWRAWAPRGRGDG